MHACSVHTDEYCESTNTFFFFFGKGHLFTQTDHVVFFRKVWTRNVHSHINNECAYRFDCSLRKHVYKENRFISSLSCVQYSLPPAVTTHTHSRRLFPLKLKVVIPKLKFSDPNTSLRQVAAEWE